MIRVVAAAIVLMCRTSVVQAQDAKERLLADANAAYRSLNAAEAVRLYREYLAAYPDRADVRVYLGGALLNLNQLPAALVEAEHAIALDPQYGKGYILAGRVCAAREQWELAQGHFEKAQHLTPRDADAWYFSGRAYYDANQFERAIGAFEQALRIDSSQSRIFENLALARDAMGEARAAGDAFRKAVELAHGTWRPYLSYGAFLFRQGNAAESLSALRQALALAPDAVEVRFELARVLYQQDNLAEAARILQPALVSNECRVHNLMARIFSARGDTGLAAIEVQAMQHCRAAGEHQ